jgi:hypothetical protein
LGYVKALYSFEGETEDEISFKKGEILRLLNNDSSDWWGGERLCANDKGEIESGFFPRTYVKKCAAPSSKRNDKTITKTTKERIDTKKMATSPNTVKSFVPSQFSLGQPFPIWVRGVRLVSLKSQQHTNARTTGTSSLYGSVSRCSHCESEQNQQKIYTITANEITRLVP